MATDGKILRFNHGSANYTRLPFLITMIDGSGELQTLPFLQEDTTNPKNTVYGIELMINPQTLTANLSKIVNRTQTMTAFAEDHWGDELDTITFQGYSAAFVVGGSSIFNVRLSGSETSVVKRFLKYKTPEEIAQSELNAITGTSDMRGLGNGVLDTEIGLTVSQRRNSVSYQQFMRLIDIIRINGCTYDTLGIVKDRKYIKIDYANASYMGFFESVDITEDASQPYRFQFTITFKSEKTLYSYVNRGDKPSIFSKTTLNAGGAGQI